MASPPVYNKSDFCGSTITREATPNPRCLFLPQNPFNGQIFIDAQRIKWRWDASLDLWCRVGAVSEVPKATSESSGLMSQEDKILLDSIPEVGGAFGFIASPLILQGPNNPDGVMEGSLVLCSESLQMTCVDSEGVEISGDCGIATCSDEVLPGIEFKLSDKFLSTLCFEATGPTGPRGDKGLDGEAGQDGFKDSPQGEQGDSGISVSEPADFLGIKIEELDEIRDSVVVDVELNAQAGRLSYATAKMNVPENDEPADQLIVTPISRTLFYPLLADNPVEYTTLDDWRVTVPPSDPLQDPDVFLFKVPSTTQVGEEIDLQAVRLSDFIQSIVDFYKACLKEYDDAWLEEICDFINQKDAAAREILSTLAQQLAECEFQRPLQFCLGIEPGECPEGRARDVTIVAPDPLRVEGNINIIPSEPPPSPSPEP